MKTFISWSGSFSHAIALELRDLLKMVFQSVEPFVSSHDLGKGHRWMATIDKAIAESQRGIICLTPDNYDSPWVLYEAGAVTRGLEQPRVYTLLVGGLDPEDLHASPLGQFQHTTFNRAEVEQLLININSELGAHQRSQEDLRRLFEQLWPKFESKIEALVKAQVQSRSRVVRIADLVRETPFLTGKVFKDVTIQGPAILGIQSPFTIQGCTFMGVPDVSAILWRPRGDIGIGAIVASHCAFYRCNFQNVGFAGSPELLDHLQQHFPKPAASDSEGDPE